MFCEASLNELLCAIKKSCISNWLKYILISTKAILKPSAKNKSENSNAVVPNAAPSEASGTKAVEAVIVVALNVLAPTIVPETSKFPLTSIKVELISTSSSALISKSPSAGEPILIALSLN